VKTTLLIGAVILLLALDWAALHDIISGEPNLYLEYGFLGFSLVAFGLMIYSGVRKKKQHPGPI
jgi:hypothetical protein